MNWREDLAGENPEMETALKHFKASVNAWSERALTERELTAAAFSKPRPATQPAMRRGWRLAASCALGCLLAAGSLTAVVHRGMETAKAAAQKAAQKAAEARAAAEREATLRAGAQAHRGPAVAAVEQKTSAQDEDLFAAVDKDVSQQVPAAMEPLAQLMDDNGTQ